MATPDSDPTRLEDQTAPVKTEPGGSAPAVGAENVTLAYVDPAGTASEADTGFDVSLPDELLAGRYRLGKRLGEGGMGTVYRAEQVSPVKRPVAVKLVKLGMDSSQVIARFEAERQALAMMDHPNIARVLDAGTTAAGRPFFVMELVEGVPLTAYCDDRRLTVRGRLGLFVAVCQAVQHAHQKGVIHRDLKPSNILVTEVDGRPVPKVIDFGLAKALRSGSLADLSVDTGFGSMLGTPMYMAPEQADLGAADVDTRADVYALGVVLYELMTGSTPLTRETIQRAALGEVLRLLHEAETPLPTARLRTAMDLASVAAVRGTEPGRLAKELRGDLEWIALKCLEKDRSRRYETANGLASDVLRHLADEPVTAGPPSRWYRAQKFVRRNRAPVLAATLVLFALIAGVLGTTWGMVRARAAERLAGDRLLQVELARGETAAALVQAESAQKKAEAAESQSKAVADYLVEAFEKPNPEADGLQLKVVDLLDKAVDKVAADKEMNVLTRARLQDALGQTFFGIGLPEKAAALQKEALATYQKANGVDDPDTLGVQYRLSFSLGHANRNDEAIRIGEDVLARRKKMLGAEHADTLLAMTQLAGRYWSDNRLDAAIPMAEQALAGQRKVWGPDHNDLPNSISNLAMLYQAAGRTADAVKLHEEAVALRKAKKGLDHADTLLAINFLGRAYEEAGRTADAIALQRDTVEKMESKFGPDHPRTLGAMSNLVRTYEHSGKASDALPIAEKALALAKSAKTTDSDAVLRAMRDLATTYSYLGRTDEALALLRETMSAATAKFGPRHDTTINAMHELGVALRKADKPAEAIPVFEQALTAQKATRSGNDIGMHQTMTQLASAYEAVGRVSEAIPLLEKLLAVQKAQLDPDHRDLLVTMATLGLSYGSAGRTADSVRMHEQVVSAFKKKFGTTHPDAQIVMRYLAAAYRKDKRLDAAAAAYRELLAVARPALPADSPDLARTLVGLGDALLEAHKFSEAEGPLKESLKIFEQKTPDDWRTFNTKSLLGATLAGLKEDDDAEPLLLAGYEGLKKRADKLEGPNKARLTEALDRLIEFYEARQKPTEAARLRAEKTP
jgi:eukaryotic-like serine/threonine-protein kinase